MLSLILPISLIAQTANGTIAGEVRDPASAAIPSAKVTLVNIATNESRNTMASSLGHYSFPLLPPAVYRIEVEAPGFKRHVRDNIKLDVALTLTVDLNVGVALTDSVTVTGEAPALEEGSSASGTSSRTAHRQLADRTGATAMDSRRWCQAFVPRRGSRQVAYGMYNDQFVSINGSRPNQNSFTLDGGNNTNPAFNGPGLFPERG